MAGRGRGMASNSHSGGPPVGLGGQGAIPGADERRELRRPIIGQTSADDISRGIAKMDPYREEFGHYGGYGSGGQQHTAAGQPSGQQAMGPPRPAPNADGWSSGENQYGQQQYQQGQWNSPANMNPFGQQDINGVNQFQQHNHFTSQQSQQHYAQQQQQQALAAQSSHQAAAAASQAWNFNIGASEFVPKNSNLSVTAHEFVPRPIPRNTSYWAQQQQQQQQEMLYQQQQQVQVEQIPVSAYQQEHNYDASGMQPNYNQASRTQQQSQPHQGYHASSGGYSNSSGGGNQSSGEMGGGYDPREMLSDAVATLVFMPTKFERTSFHLAEKFNFSVSDLNTLTSLVSNLVDTCLTEKNFRSMAGRFCDYLASNVRLEFDGITFRSLLLEKFQTIHANHTQLISNDPEQFRSLVIFATDFYLRFLQDKKSSSNETAEEPPCSETKERQPVLANLLYQLYLSAITVDKPDATNLQTVIDMLKLSGKLLEEDEKASSEDGTKATQLDNLMGTIEKLSQNEAECPANLRKSLAQLIKTRAANWEIEANDRPTIFDIPDPKGPAASTASATGKRSNAIKIVKPPEEPTNRGPQNGSNTNRGGNKPNSVSKTSAALPPEEHGLTEAELRFMSEQMGETDSEAGGVTGGGESDIGSIEGMMPEEVEAAFQEFLNEQKTNGDSGSKS